MPTSRISAGILAGLTPGLQRGAQAFAGGDMAYDKGFEQQASLQSKLAQALASTRLANAKADEAEREAAFQSPTALRDNALATTGIPLDAASDAETFVKTGKLGSQYDALPADQQGPVLPRPGWESKLGSFARQLAATQNALAIGDKSSSSIAKGLETNREMALGDAIIAGTADPMKVSQSQYAVKGSAPFHFSEYGVGNNLTGKLDDSTGPAQLFARNRQAEIEARQAQAGASRASAASSYASADNSRASAAQKRSETERGIKSGDIVVQQGADGSIQLVNKLTGISRPATDADGETLKGKGAAGGGGKPLPASAAKGYLDNQTNMQRAEKALALVEGMEYDGAKGDKAATGLKGVLPMQVLNRVDPKGVDTRAAVADLGSLVIHDRSGAAVTASEFPRLAPFIPTVYDDQATSAKKLRLFVKNYKAIVEDAEEFYKASGYNVPKITPRGPAAPAPAAPAAGGFTYLGKE